MRKFDCLSDILLCSVNCQYYVAGHSILWSYRNLASGWYFYVKCYFRNIKWKKPCCYFRLPVFNILYVLLCLLTYNRGFIKLITVSLWLQGALVGGVASMAFVSWISIGSQIAIAKGQIKFPTKPMSVDGCDSDLLNNTHNFAAIPAIVWVMLEIREDSIM